MDAHEADQAAAQLMKATVAKYQADGTTPPGWTDEMPREQMAWTAAYCRVQGWDMDDMMQVLEAMFRMSDWMWDELKAKSARLDGE